MADAIWSHILNDRKWLDWFFAENKRRLGDTAEFTRDWFKVRGIPVARSNALVPFTAISECNELILDSGNFLMVHLGKRIQIKTDEEETAVSDRLIAGGVFLVSACVTG